MFPTPVRATKIVPMPKKLCTSSERVLCLGTAAGSGVLTELEASTFALRKQIRTLPVIHKLILHPQGSALGYTQKHAHGNPSELHFLDPDLDLLRTAWLPDAATDLAFRGGEWVVACRDGAVHCFDDAGDLRWIWQAPHERRKSSSSQVLPAWPSTLEFSASMVQNIPSDSRRAKRRGRAPRMCSDF